MVSMMTLHLHPRGSGLNPHPDPGLNVLEVSHKADHFLE